ncbi:MAG TPA: 6-carboxytetrahydropterin synthase [Thermoanaerobaculia bacterium]|jgi:6-pyruvoyltetrahydropterin/6-carboxytetrahydropterin synthase|nr:6-carboxytetrahydropterin synthase [Thermoanaerobaculia bacterium]
MTRPQDPRTGAVPVSPEGAPGGGSGGADPPGTRRRVMRLPQDPRTGAVATSPEGTAGGARADPAGGAAGIRLERRYRFSASHLYRRPEWTDEENRARFGKCANVPGHGHNYRLFVTVRGQVDPVTGFVADLGRLDALVTRLVLDRLDHQHLNSALPEFGPGRHNPSSEALIRWIRDQLAPALPTEVTLVRLRLEEDEDLAAEWLLADG